MTLSPFEPFHTPCTSPRPWDETLKKNDCQNSLFKPLVSFHQPPTRNTAQPPRKVPTVPNTAGRSYISQISTNPRNHWAIAALVLVLQTTLGRWLAQLSRWVTKQHQNPFSFFSLRRPTACEATKFQAFRAMGLQRRASRRRRPAVQPTVPFFYLHTA